VNSSRSNGGGARAVAAAKRIAVLVTRLRSVSRQPQISEKIAPGRRIVIDCPCAGRPRETHATPTSHGIEPHRARRGPDHNGRPSSAAVKATVLTRPPPTTRCCIRSWTAASTSSVKRLPDQHCGARVDSETVARLAAIGDHPCCIVKQSATAQRWKHQPRRRGGKRLAAHQARRKETCPQLINSGVQAVEHARQKLSEESRTAIWRRISDGSEWAAASAKDNRRDAEARTTSGQLVVHDRSSSGAKGTYCTARADCPRTPKTAQW